MTHLKFICYLIMLIIGFVGAILWIDDIVRLHERPLWTSIPFAFCCSYTGFIGFFSIQKIVKP